MSLTEERDRLLREVRHLRERVTILEEQLAAKERELEWSGRLLRQAHAQSGSEGPFTFFAAWLAALSLNTSWGDQRDEKVWGRMPDGSSPYGPDDVHAAAETMGRVSETPPLSRWTADSGPTGTYGPPREQPKPERKP